MRWSGGMDKVVEGSGPVVGSVASAFRILDCLADSPRPLRLKDIAGALGLNTSTCLNILRTMTRAGVVHNDRGAKTYSPGLGLASLARAALLRDARLTAARPLMEALARKRGLTVMLWRRFSSREMVLLHVASGDDAWQVQVQVGSRAPLLQGSMGRLMATQTDLAQPELRDMFEALKWDRPISFDEFMAQAEAARGRGWATDEGYFHRSMASISVPVMDEDGGVTSLLSAAMFAGQYQAEFSAEIVEDLKKIAGSVHAAK
jgi:DNA-binding IclR family transcriptional regulator